MVTPWFWSYETLSREYPCTSIESEYYVIIGNKNSDALNDWLNTVLKSCNNKMWVIN